MDNVMILPKTVDKFMEQYKIVDTENLYTNGAELIPLFRMKQWFEHSEKHGRWIEIDHPWYECSECGERTAVVNLNGEVVWNYCPNCGARMDGNE